MMFFLKNSDFKCPMEINFNVTARLGDGSCPFRRELGFLHAFDTITNIPERYYLFFTLQHLMVNCLMSQDKNLTDTSDLKLDKTGFLAAIPYLAMAIIVQCGGQLADWLRSRWRVETTKVSKEFTY